MKVVAVTGGIAGGKSAVCRMLAALGAQVRSADEDARAVLAYGSATLLAVRAAFPEAAMPDGSLDRAILAARIFTDADARARLNVLMHPAIRDLMQAAIDSARKTEMSGILVYEVPLLYEGGLETWFDAVIAVVATPAKQAERLQERETAAGRPPLSEEAVTERLTSQIPPEEKARRADFVVRTDVSLQETQDQVAVVWTKLTVESACHLG